MKKLIVLCLVIFLVPTHTLVFGDSNLGIMGYPSADCFKPTAPYRPSSFNNQGEVDSYNAEVNSYKDEVQSYSICINEYLENARYDIQAIRDRVQDILNEVKD